MTVAAGGDRVRSCAAMIQRWERRAQHLGTMTGDTGKPARPMRWAVACLAAMGCAAKAPPAAPPAAPVPAPSIAAPEATAPTPAAAAGWWCMTFRSLGVGSCHASRDACTAKRAEWTRAAPQAEADIAMCERQDSADCFSVRDAKGAVNGICQPSYAACLTSFDMHDLEQGQLTLTAPCHPVLAGGRGTAPTDEQRNTHWQCYAGARVGVGSCARLARVCEADRKDMAQLAPGPCAPQRTAHCYERRAAGVMTRSCQPSAANCEHERAWAHDRAKPGETVGACRERE